MCGGGERKTSSRPIGAGAQPQQVVEDVDQQQAGEEDRQRHAGRRDDAAEMVDPGALLHRRQRRRAGWRPRRPGAGRTGSARPRPAGGSAISATHRLAGAERVAEIAVRQVADIGDELLGQRLVEAELGADLGDRLRARRQARRSRPPGRRAAARVSRKVTMTTPTMLGIAVASRDSSSFSIAAPTPHPEEDRRAVSKGERDHACATLRDARCARVKSFRMTVVLALRQLAVVELAVEPVAVAGDVLLHRHVEQRLEDRHARHLLEGDVDEALRPPPRTSAGRSKRAASISLSIAGFL